MSLDPDNKKQKNYRENITELKKTLKFMIDDKGETKNSFYTRYFRMEEEQGHGEVN